MHFKTLKYSTQTPDETYSKCTSSVNFHNQHHLVRKQNITSMQEPTWCLLPVTPEMTTILTSNHQLISPVFVLDTNGIIQYIIYCIWNLLIILRNSCYSMLTVVHSFSLLCSNLYILSICGRVFFVVGGCPVHCR